MLSPDRFQSEHKLISLSVLCVRGCWPGGVSFSSHHQTVTGRLGMGLPHSSFFSQLVSPWDRESFSFLRDQDASCPEPKFAVTALVLVGFHLGGLGRV